MCINNYKIIIIFQYNNVILFKIILHVCGCINALWLLVFLYSQWVWDMITSSVGNPSQECIEKWLGALSRKLGVKFVYSSRTHKLLANRVFHLRSKLRKFKGGRQRKEFLDQDWCFIVKRVDTVFREDVEKENSHLKEMVHELEQKVSDQGTFIKKITADKTRMRGRKRSLEEYSGRQKRRLKNQRTRSCEMSLSWLEKEDCIPLKVFSLNRLIS